MVCPECVKESNKICFGHWFNFEIKKNLHSLRYDKKARLSFFAVISFILLFALSYPILFPYHPSETPVLTLQEFISYSLNVKLPTLSWVMILGFLWLTKWS